MNTINKKLKDNSGISILFAILFLLVVTIVSAVMIATAAANLSRTGNRHEIRQEYLTLKSFADILIEGFGSVEYNGMRHVDTLYTEYPALLIIHCDTGADHDQIADSTEFNISGRFGANQQLKSKLENAALQCAKGPQSFTFNMNIAGMEQEYGKVEVTATVEQDYTLKFRLHYIDGNYTDYVITYTPLASTVPVSEEHSHYYQRTVTESDGITEIDHECIYTYIYEKSRVVWQNPVIEEAED